MNKPVALLFSDDSTLIFARRMYDLLSQADATLQIDMVHYKTKGSISNRQMSMYLPAGPDKTLAAGELKAMSVSGSYSALITSRVYDPINDTLSDPLERVRPDRPCIVSFLGGLDFFPHEGFTNRQYCDVVFLFPKAFLEKFRKHPGRPENFWQEIEFGHPSNLRSRMADAGRINTAEDASPQVAAREDIYFFTQALSPSTYRARLHIVRMLCVIARRNPDRTIWIKLRHLPNENQQHQHIERYDYISILNDLPEKPPANLRWTACKMSDALRTAKIGITCTSTAALDLVQANVPTMIYLDYPDNYADPLVTPMHDLFSDSGLIRPLEDVLHLRPQHAQQTWLEEMFCSADLGRRVLSNIERFHAAL